MRIFNDLADRPSLREMCTNPLILSMYVAQDQLHGGAQAPETRTEFYARVTEELVIRRRARQVGRDNAQMVLREERMEILSRIAHEHLVETTAAANLLNWKDVIEIIQRFNKSTWRDAENYFRELSKDTGIITEERQEETCRFIHLTFCEFLAANQAVHWYKCGWQDLIKRHSEWLGSANSAVRARLIEVIPFSCALLPPHSRQDALEAVKKTGDQRALTMAFLETKNYNQDLWTNFVSGRQEELLNFPLENRDAIWLEDLHYFVVMCKDAEKVRNNTERKFDGSIVENIFKIIASQSDQSLIKVVSSYAEHDAVAAFRIVALCGLDMFSDLSDLVIRSCDQPPFVALLIDQAPRDNGRLVQLACLFAEAGLRSPAASTTLQKVEFGLFIELIDVVPKEARWFSEVGIRRNFFTECLSIALSVEVNPHLYVLSKYRSLPSWSWMNKRFRRARLVSFMLLGLGFVIWAVIIIGVYNGYFVTGYDTKNHLVGFNVQEIVDASLRGGSPWVLLVGVVGYVCLIFPALLLSGCNAMEQRYKDIVYGKSKDTVKRAGLLGKIEEINSVIYGKRGVGVFGERLIFSGKLLELIRNLS